MINIDLHIHTNYSFDGKVPIDKVVDIAKSKGLNGIAITDHNTIEGGLKLKDKMRNNGFILIVGEEIKTKEGEITALFLSKNIPQGLSPEETIERIKLQNGLVIIPHPFCRFRKSKLKTESLMRIIDAVDIIEIFNSRNIFNTDNKKAYALAKEHNKAMAVGSDGHLGYEYGRSYVKMDFFDDAQDFRRKLLSAEFVTQKSPLWVHFVTKWMKMTVKEAV